MNKDALEAELNFLIESKAKVDKFIELFERFFDETETQIVKDIGKNINWLRDNAQSDNIMLITKKVNELQIQSSFLANQVIKAYGLMNESEDAYKASIAKFVAAYEGSAASGERKAEAEYVEQKKAWTAAKNLYKKFDIILDRIDKICDSQRQRISVVKQADLKNL